MRILFISRAYPPVVGGIENQNAALSVWLAKHAPTKTLANRLGKKFLPFFLPWATLRVLLALPSFDTLLLGDGVLAPLGWIVKKAAPKKTVVAVIHGLDITYRNRIYQKWWVHGFLPGLDGFIAVSQATKTLARDHGLPTEKLFVVHNGIDDRPLAKPDRPTLEKLIKKDLSQMTILLSAGRLVQRKGVAWFLEHVFLTLPTSFVYCIAGDGPERVRLQALITQHHLEERVFLLGRVDQPTLEILWGTADLFIQPNRPIANDIEGFGIAVLEASAAGLPVIASRLEGLQEAIIDGKNGFLVPPEDSTAFRECILAHEQAKAHSGLPFAQYTLEHFSWSRISEQYRDLLEDFRKSVIDSH